MGFNSVFKGLNVSLALAAFEFPVLLPDNVLLIYHAHGTSNAFSHQSQCWTYTLNNALYRPLL
jgi:hypothetical protein